MKRRLVDSAKNLPGRVWLLRYGYIIHGCDSLDECTLGPKDTSSADGLCYRTSDTPTRYAHPCGCPKSRGRCMCKAEATRTKRTARRESRRIARQAAYGELDD